MLQTKSIEDKKTWLRRLNRTIDANISNPFFSNIYIAKKMGIDKNNLNKMLKNITGLTPNKYIRYRRLKKAKNYLEKGTFYTVQEAAFEVGFINVGYFNREFIKMFDISPFQILKDYGWR